MSEYATVAAGCFWGVEALFRPLSGVINTAVGYTGGHTENPSYEQVCSDTTGHAEAVLIEFDPSQISYEALLRVFWDNHDPTTLNRQGPDRGSQYRSAVFYHSEQQAHIAQQLKAELAPHYQQPIVTEIVPASRFYYAEDYHQQYFAKRGIVAHCHAKLK
ncbi:peptide-methionine (S)-S-oxide reductase MsrA [Thioflexithrix psekupsensis]|uniref:Peptide methionine sulfoxide reductase MsrA n=1 Tax=Thioflexithrix psekupsensis TaxID=1570016 RepID=A0A251XAE5_9GAMM|nr:peptide-methionine (S)-S-oxide reductase MsrA [Thioflexithrix psekupsensis]OUD15401.1 peptide-methionine (S)-S-oxide reductase [Thioflexithrix psekupsensis]